MRFVLPKAEIIQVAYNLPEETNLSFFYADIYISVSCSLLSKVSLLVLVHTAKSDLIKPQEGQFMQRWDKNHCL